MSKVIPFSRTFPSYHTRAGEDTHFVEQIWNGLKQLDLPLPKNSEFTHEFMWSILPLSNYGCKFTTVRAGNRWKVGDKFSPRVWSGRPYHTKQIIIAPDIEVKKIWDIWADWHKGDLYFFFEGFRVISSKIALEMAKNDGLSIDDFNNWFAKAKQGQQFQIICWNENIEY